MPIREGLNFLLFSSLSDHLMMTQSMYLHHSSRATASLIAPCSQNRLYRLGYQGHKGACRELGVLLVCELPRITSYRVIFKPP